MATTRRAYTGGAQSTTTTSNIASSGTTSFTITAYTGWPYGSDPFFVVVEPGTSSEEKILVTRTGSTDTTINIASDSERAQDGTSAVAHSSGSVVFPVFTALDADEANELTSSWSTKGDLVSYGSSTFETLGVGSDGQFLRADSGETSGLAWETYTNTLGSGAAVRNMGEFVGGDILQAAELNKFFPLTVLSNSSVSVTSGSSAVPSFASELIDVRDWHSNSVNNDRITVDQAGWYCVFAFSRNWDTTTSRSLLRLKQNNNIIGLEADLNGYARALSFNGVLEASASDYFHVELYQNSGTTKNIDVTFGCYLLRAS